MGKKCRQCKVLLLIFILSFGSFFINSLICTQVLAEESAQIEVFFSPQDNCAQQIISAINNAKDYVYVAMYYFTSRPIAQALIQARDRGVDVKVCLDKGQPAYEYSKSRFLENNGINLKLIGGSGIMHNKFCIIDDYTTLTGSYNWTARADLENDENVLVIKSKEIAMVYKEQFNKFWNGTYIDTCEYRDKNKLEKVPIATSGVLPVSKGLSEGKGKYVASKNSDKFHCPDCKWAQKIKPENQIWFKSRQEAIEKSYIPCRVCNP